MNLDRLRDVALDAAQSAGKVLKSRFGTRLDIREKKGAGLVTNADVEAEQVALSIVRKAFPDFGVLTEESAEQLRPSPGRFIMDPLDGTTNFVHGFPMFCVSIAAVWENQIVVGAIYHPILDETYLAVRGRGATLDGKPIRVSDTRDLSNSLLTTGFSYDRGDSLHEDVTTFEKLSNRVRAIRRPGSAALDLAYTARGVFDGFWERNLSAWDLAAGALLVEEAGGRVTDYQGRPYLPDYREIIVANPALHSEILQVVSPGTRASGV